MCINFSQGDDVGEGGGTKGDDDDGDLIFPMDL